MELNVTAPLLSVTAPTSRSQAFKAPTSVHPSVSACCGSVSGIEYHRVVIMRNSSPFYTRGVTSRSLSKCEAGGGEERHGKEKVRAVITLSSPYGTLLI